MITQNGSMVHATDNMPMEQDKLKRMLLDMLKWFHAFCEANDLRYYALGGTMLGAVRHEGFIPWDDDIDIGMPREDYNKLEELFAKAPSQRYILETPNTPAKDFNYPFSKLYDTTTTLIENNKYKIKRGIYLDIFPLDGIGNSMEEARKNYKSIGRTYNLLLARATGIRKGRKFYKNLSVIAFRLIPINTKRILGTLTKKCSRYSWGDCSWGGNLAGAWRFREVMPKKYMGKPTLYKFEDTLIYGAENADAYLTNLYGDWRELPPPEKRITHHDYVLMDLERSYKEQ